MAEHAVAKVIEVVGSSPDGWTEAADAAVRTAGKTIKHITGVQVGAMTAQEEQQPPAFGERKDRVEHRGGDQGDLHRSLPAEVPRAVADDGPDQEGEHGGLGSVESCRLPVEADGREGWSTEEACNRGMAHLVGQGCNEVERIAGGPEQAVDDGDQATGAQRHPCGKGSAQEVVLLQLAVQAPGFGLKRCQQHDTVIGKYSCRYGAWLP